MVLYQQRLVPFHHKKGVRSMTPLTNEEIDQKILDYHQRTNGLHSSLHNTYYIYSVNQDGEVTQEAFGTNLMTDTGMSQIFHWNHDHPNNFAFTFYIGSGTTVPSLSDTTMNEYINICSGYTVDVNPVITGYHDLNTTDHGAFYTIRRAGYGWFDYQMTLPAGNTSDHCGGSPDSETRDTRWLQDNNDGRWYFNITEIGCSIDDSNAYEKIDGNNYYVLGKNRLSFHFLVRDVNGNVSPIRKYQNEKLFIHVYHTGVVAEQLILDNWENKQYLLINPEALWWINNNAVFSIAPVTGDKFYDEWDQYIIDSFHKHTNSNYSYYCIISGNSSKSPTGFCNNVKESGYPNFKNLNEGNTSASKREIKATWVINERLIELSRMYVSEYIFGIFHGYSSNKLHFNDGDKHSGISFLSMQIYEQLPEAEEIKCEIYTNYYTDGYINRQLGLYDSDTGPNFSYKYGLIPTTKLESVSALNLFNADTNEYDIPVGFENISNRCYFVNKFSQQFNCQMMSFICPDGKMRDVYVYINPFAAKKKQDNSYDPAFTGAWPGQIIDQFTNTGITLFAADKYWDVSTWRKFDNTNDVDEAIDENNQLLVQKRYFICYSNIELSWHTRSEDTPCITSAASYHELTTGGFNSKALPEVGSDDDNWFTIGDYIIRVNNNNEFVDSHVCKFPSRIYGRMASGVNFVYRDANTTYGHYVMINTSETWDNDMESDKFKELQIMTNNAEDNQYMDYNNGDYMISWVNNDNLKQIQIIDISKTFNEIETEMNETLFTVHHCSIENMAWENKGLNLDTNYFPAQKGDIVYPYAKWKTDSGNSSSYNNGNWLTDYNYWSIYEYDENDNLLNSSINQITPYPVTNENTNHVKVLIIGNAYAYRDFNRINGNDKTKMVDRMDVVVSKNYADICPIIPNAIHGICIRGTNLLCYNDISEYDPLRIWNIVDMSDPLNQDGTPKIIQTFEVDEANIGGTFTGGFGFAHYVYFRMNDKQNRFSTWYYDTTSQSLTNLADVDWGEWFYKESTGERQNYICGNDKCLIACCTDDEFNNAIYIIAEDQPDTRYVLRSNGYYKSYRYANMKYVTWGNQQRSLVAYGGTSNKNYTAYYGRYGDIFVLDVGLWLKTHSWINGEPIHRFNNIKNGSTGSYRCPCYVHKKGVVEIANRETMYSSNTLVYSPLEYHLPMEITCTTKTIQAFNNPIIVGGDKTFEITLTNDFSLIEDFPLREDGSHVWDGSQT